jgi:hypothetical protein
MYPLFTACMRLPGRRVIAFEDGDMYVCMDFILYGERCCRTLCVLKSPPPH